MAATAAGDHPAATAAQPTCTSSDSSSSTERFRSLKLTTAGARLSGLRGLPALTVERGEVRPLDSFPRQNSLQDTEAKQQNGGTYVNAAAAGV
jgi:hypothetical protein